MNGSTRRWSQVAAVSRGELVFHLRSVCRWLTLPALVLACQARVEVGHSREPVECAGCETEEVPTQIPPAPSATVPAVPTPVPTSPEDCEDHVYPARQTYDAWQLELNDLGELAGKTFVGYIEGGPDLTLTISTDGSATLVVDEAADPPVAADEGYLCQQALLDALDCDLTSVVSGGTYPLHGATLSGSRLQAPVPVAAAFDDWCALQVPIYWSDGCYYSAESPAGYSYSDGYCTVDGVEADCAWMLLVQSHLCECTSSECFAANSLNVEGLDVRLSDDGTELTGSLLSHSVYFERQP